jgi:dTDP-4-dehydrorhamnose reductase
MIILTGAHSLIGGYLLPMLRNSYQVCAFDDEHGDIRDHAFIEQLFRETRPSVFINCAQNDNIEECEYKREEAYSTNSVIPSSIAELCSINKTLFVQASTVYVFNGREDSPYRETDKTHPITVYGDSKDLAEKRIKDTGCRHLIVRFPHLYGRGQSFLSQFVEKIKDAEKIVLPRGQMIMPTYAFDAAKMIIDLLSNDCTGTVHCGNDGIVRIKDFLYEFAVLMGKRNERNYIVNIEECDIEEYLSPYDIPINCIFDLSLLKNEIGEKNIRGWESALETFIEEDAEHL